MAQVLLAAGNPKAQAAFATLLDDMAAPRLCAPCPGRKPCAYCRRRASLWC